MTRNWTRTTLWLGLIIGLALAGCSTATPVAPTGTPAPTDTPVPPTVVPPPSGGGAGQVKGTITAYETNEKGGNLFVMALGVVRDEQGQPTTRPDVDIANLPKAQADAEGGFNLPQLPAGEYVFAVNKDGNSNNPNTSLVGDSNRQILVLAVKPGETTQMDGYFLQERLEQPTPVVPATPPVAMVIDTSKEYTATIKTDVGDIKLALYANRAPVTVNNFVSLARKGFYDNTTFHRVIEGFMAQGGDPTGTGTGGPGYAFMDEILPDLKFDKAGVLAMANAGPNTNGSQFFITFAPASHLDGQHTIFGQVVEGEDVLPKIVRRDPQDPNAPAATKIISITIDEGK